ncbi:hypothetical protein BTO20_05930 [Mycobacterium dioxanotrophicus]|uniref:Replicative helicase inhibitor G39P N-terminal domain-containing protein n=1 Tax=Mycobacterium dioxanotrophicus TaxID=482462 RepID=A0A1Y0BZ85_9MYCO|nr:hypothetical protein [Mycobacterium dioxanotrophicus]ART68185.1 hypothetical protein BTO20_05930 [Mycobacterium dioxanotrophicus]
MTTVADALEVMTLIVACHHRTAPRMDDREATIATATIWAELFSQYGLELPDLLAGVKRRALGNAEAPEPAEIITAAREYRAQRCQAESRAEREAREDRQDAALEARNHAKLAAITSGFGKAIE